MENKYIYFTNADFPVFLTEMAIKGGYKNLIFLHERSFGGLYISAADAEIAAKTGFKLYSNSKAINRLIEKGYGYSNLIKKFLAQHPAANLKTKTSAELKRALAKYYAIGIPFLRIYSFTEGIYSPLIEKTVRNFFFENISDKNEAGRAYGLLLNPVNKKRIEAQRNKIIKETAAPGVIVNLCRSVREMGKAKFLFRSTINQSYLFLTSLLQECARRNYYSLAQIQACRHSETAAILDGKKIEAGKLNERINRYAALAKNGKPEFFTGQAAQRIIVRVKLAIPENITEFRGDPASAGRATGKVKIVPVMMAKGGPAATQARIKEMKKGDILVANTTGPEMIAAFKKAGAIVANEGGINSHAAIVSRELGIPGIVNTKIATQVLKDGDIVEVDADNGIVKIIQKAR